MKYAEKFQRRAGILAAAMMLGALSVAAKSRPADAPNRLVNYGSGLCLQPLSGAGKYSIDGLAIVQTTCTQDREVSPQHWSLVFVGAGTVPGQPGVVNLYHVVNELSRQCLDDRDGKIDDRAAIQQWSCNTSSVSMKWAIGRSNNGFSELVNALSGKCLDIPGGSVEPGSVVQQTRCSRTSLANYAQLYAFL